MWRYSENSEAVRPEAFERSVEQVILRRNFRAVEATEEKPEHYEYEEWQMSAEQYEIYQNFEEAISEQSDALVELAGLISEVIE